MLTDDDSTRLPGATVALAALLCVAAATPAAAAGSTALVASPAAPAVQAGGTTTVTLALADADGGVGSAALRVEATDPAVATVADVSVPGAPTTSNVTVDADGGGADVRYEGANTPRDEGEVAVATVTLAGEAPGEAGIEVAATAAGDGPRVADETGAAYALTELGTATVRVVAENLPPRADAGSNRTVESAGPNESPVLRLDGRNSTDPDGDDGALTYAWTQVGGPSVSLGNAGTARPLYDVPRVETERVLRFRLTVTDADGASDADGVAVTVTPPPAPADLEVSNVTAADAAPNASGTVTAEVRNAGGRADADTATVSVDVDGDGVLESDEVVGTAFVSVAPGETATASFEVDTTGLTPGAYRLGVSAFGANATGTLVVVDPGSPDPDPDPAPATPPVADGFARPTNADDDAALEDVNGNGAFTLADVTALFEHRESDAVTNNPEAFDFNGNGAFTLADVTALFGEAR
jgi:hypothetical protein